MKLLARAPYALAARLARAAAELTPAGDGKLRASLHARRGVVNRFTRWAAAHRDLARPLLWMHAPSVGEGLQARPVLDLLRARHPEWQIVYTFFSPSAEQFARALAVDYTDYLPFDSAPDMAALCDALCPTALIFSKLDVWPVLVESAAARGIPLGMISATVSGISSRNGRIADWVLRDAYAALDAIGAVDGDDAQRLIAMGARTSALHVTGDTRYDQVALRAQHVDRASALLAPLASARPTLVAGSTWPSDEAPLLTAWRALRTQVPDARLIIAPHEPTPDHLEPVERAAHQLGLVVARLGSDAQRTADVIVVDRVGVLGDLYALADVAFVGGGFHSAGLHSVVEPAAFGAPVLFGAQHRNARDAALLVRAGGGFSVSSSEAVETVLVRLFCDESVRVDAGARALALVSSGLGAAERSAALVEGLLLRGISASGGRGSSASGGRG
jgi:3-deoxy-D-manno-octulosonic-acid transferase